MKTYKQMGELDGEVVKLASDDNFLYAMVEDGTVYKYDGEEWQEVNDASKN